MKNKNPINHLVRAKLQHNPRDPGGISLEPESKNQPIVFSVMSKLLTHF